MKSTIVRKVTHVVSERGISQFIRRNGVDFFSWVFDQGIAFHASNGQTTTPVKLQDDFVNEILKTHRPVFLNFRKGGSA